MDAEIIFLPTLLDRNHIAPSCAQLRGLVSLCAEEGEVIRYGLAWKLYHTIQNHLISTSYIICLIDLCLPLKEINSNNQPTFFFFASITSLFLLLSAYKSFFF